MTNNTDEYGISKSIDESYIDVEKQRADISDSTEVEENDNIDRSPPSAQRVDISVDSFDMSHIFDTGSGSGASNDVDELIDENAIIENDGRSMTRTFYYPSEAPERTRKRFSRMLRWQEGEGDSQRDVENRAADRRRTVETFCGHLEMTTHHRRRVQHIADSINMSHMAHYSSQEVILGIITIVANEDNRFIRDEDAFKSLVDDVGSDMYTVKRIRGLVRRKSEEI